MDAPERSPSPSSAASSPTTSVVCTGPSTKAAIQLIKCTSDGCLPPREVPGGEIKAQQLSVREAHIRWKERPGAVLVVKKWRDHDVTRQAVYTALWIMRRFGVTVYLDAEMPEWAAIRRLIRHVERRRVRAGKPSPAGLISGQEPVQEHTLPGMPPDLTAPTARVSACANSASPVHPLTGTTGLLPFTSACSPTLDLILCLGGDGTVLHLSSLFQGPMPPVISLSAGSLGFMTVFNKERLREVLEAIFDGVPRGSDALLARSHEGQESPGLSGVTEATTMPQQAGSVLQVSSSAAMPTLGLDLHAPPADSSSALGGAGGADAGTEGADAGTEGADAGAAVCLTSNGEVVTRTKLAPAPPPMPRTTAARPSPVLPGRDSAAVPVTMRMRLMCAIHRKGQKKPHFVRLVLNEITLERGLRPLAAIDAYVDGEPLTTIYADGVIVATPTGSTAYSLAAGGTMALPSVPAILFTPICPHSLSFRPLMMPDSATIKLVVPPDARGSVRINLDGRVPDGLAPEDCELGEGDFVVVRMSRYPLPLVTRKGTVGDWVRSITEKLNWNVRERQKALGAEATSGAGTAAGSGTTLLLLDSDSESGGEAAGRAGATRGERGWGSGYSSDEDDAASPQNAATAAMPSHPSLTAMHSRPGVRWTDSGAAGAAPAEDAEPAGALLLQRLRRSVDAAPPPVPVPPPELSPAGRPHRAPSEDNPTLYNRPRRHNSTYGYIE